jgi:cytochrome oxidase Cu insertion factor (SCO1/SenC/PrrC family)
MKKILLSFVFLSTFIISGQVNNYQEGDVVDDFTVTDINGNQYSLHNLTSQGKYVYLDFFYTSCEACKTVIPIFNEFWDKYGCGANEIFCIAINRGVDNDMEVADFENQYGGNFNHAPAISNEGGSLDVVNNFGVNVYPTICLIGPDNKLINKNIRPVENVKNLEDALPDSFTPQPAPCSSGITSIEDFQAKIYVSEDKKLVISLDKFATYKLQIVDITGKIIWSQLQHTSPVFINHLKPGVYIVNIQVKRGTYTKKIVLY